MRTGCQDCCNSPSSALVTYTSPHPAAEQSTDDWEPPILSILYSLYFLYYLKACGDVLELERAPWRLPLRHDSFVSVRVHNDAMTALRHPVVLLKLLCLLFFCQHVTCHVIVGHAMPWMTSHQLQVGVMGKELAARGHTFIMLLSSCDAATLARVGGVPEGIQVMEYPSPLPSHGSCDTAKQATLLAFSTKLPGLVGRACMRLA